MFNEANKPGYSEPCISVQEDQGVKQCFAVPQQGTPIPSFLIWSC